MEMSVAILSENGVHEKVIRKLRDIFGDESFEVNEENLLHLSALTNSLRWFPRLFMSLEVYAEYSRLEDVLWAEVERDIKPFFDDYLVEIRDTTETYNRPNLSVEELSQVLRNKKKHLDRLTERQAGVCRVFWHKTCSALFAIMEREGL